MEIGFRNLHVCHASGSLFPVPGDERNGCTLFKELDAVLYPPRLYAQLAGNEIYVL